MQIVTANSNHLPELVIIYNQAITARQTADTKPLSISQRQAWFDVHQNEKYPLYVAIANDDTVMGYATLSQYRGGRPALRYAVEVSYYIHNQHQRKGLGSSLLAHLLKEAKRIGFKNAFAILLDTNIPSIKLLEKFGFEKWGHLPEIAEIDGKTCGHYYYGRKI